MTPETIKSERLACGLSQADLAKELDVNVMTIWRWEKGQRTPSPSTKKLLKIIFNLKKPVD